VKVENSNLKSKKDTYWSYYNIITDNLDFKVLPKLEYRSITSIGYYSWNKKVFLWSMNDNKKNYFDLNWNKIKKTKGGNWILWFTDKLDIISIKDNKDKTYTIKENNITLFSVDRKIPEIVFSKNNSKFFTIHYDKEKWKYIYDSDNLLRTTINSNFSYTDDLKYITTDNVISYNWKSNFQNKHNIPRNLKYSDDGKKLLFYIWDWWIWNDYICDLGAKKDFKDDKKQITKKIKIKSKKEFTFSLIKSKVELNKTEKWKKYIKKINKIKNIIFPKLSNERLLKLFTKIDKIDLNNKKYKKFRNLLLYLKSKVWIEINGRDLNY
jgi:hypothetical protein